MNMSYCRFQNTLSDLSDCREQIQLLMDNEGADKITDRAEIAARAALVVMCLEIAEMFPSINDRVMDREAAVREELYLKEQQDQQDPE